PLPYLSRADSPFDLSGLGKRAWLEDFEDGLLNVPGVSFSSGVPLSVFGPAATADSVDGDDGVIDGRGTQGRSLGPTNNDAGSSPHGVTFTFDAKALGGYPTFAGIVWTDGTPDDTIVFEAFDASGQSLGTVVGPHIGDNSFNGTTAEDRFFGVSSARGISSIR